MTSDFGEVITPAHALGLRDVMARENKKAWCYFPPFLCAFSLPPNRVVRVCDREGHVCLLVQRPEGVDLLCPPMPFSASILMGLVQELADVNMDRALRILWVDESDVAQLAGLPFVCEEKDSEYLYDPDLIAQAQGPAFRDVRKQVHKFENVATFRNMTAGDLADCEGLLKYWRKQQGRKHPFLLDWGYTRAALTQFSNWQSPDLQGWCVEWDGDLVAFAMAGEIRADVAQFFIAKTDPDVLGLSMFLRWCVYRELAGYRLVNDASDLGLPGLRQFKQKFRPVARLRVYSAAHCREDSL